MAATMAQRRAARAQRRKAVVAMKRKQEGSWTALSLVGRVRRAVAGPIERCVVHEGLFEGGAGTLILTRQTGSGDLALGAFLIDVYCLGIKDVAFSRLTASELDEDLARQARAAPLVTVEPSYARKLLRDAAAYAESIGFAPHRDFAAVEALFGDVRAEDCDAVFQFGHEGKPLYIAGPSETPAAIRQRLQRLRSRLGADGFDFVLPADEYDTLAADRWHESLPA